MGRGEVFEEAGSGGDSEGSGGEHEVRRVGAAGNFVAEIAVACCLLI